MVIGVGGRGSSAACDVVHIDQRGPNQRSRDFKDYEISEEVLSVNLHTRPLARYMAISRLPGPFFHFASPCPRKAARMSTSALSQPHRLNTPPNTIPRFLYGTAWKKERTADLVYDALKAGFKGIDTAAQPRHYNEKLVGDGIRRAIASGIVERGDLFIQTKYTPISGQDPDNLPYDPTLSISDQIHASVASSLSNLSTGDNTYLDSIVLHSPIDNQRDTIAAMQTLSTYITSGKVRSVGIANISFPIMTTLISNNIKPAIVQNRFVGRTGFDRQIRRLCRENGIVYQSFWTLTGNPNLLQWPEIGIISQKAGVSREMALYALVMGLEGITVLNGTTNKVRMQEDLEGLEKIGKWIESLEGREDWEEFLDEFRRFVGDIET